MPYALFFSLLICFSYFMSSMSAPEMSAMEEISVAINSSDSSITLHDLRTNIWARFFVQLPPNKNQIIEASCKIPLETYLNLKKRLTQDQLAAIEEHVTRCSGTIPLEFRTSFDD